MATKLFDTDTLTYSELIPRGRKFVVPAYQRDYSWEIEQWEDLWEDIMDLRGEEKEKHYLGAIVVQETASGELIVIDGQQRLVTLSLLSMAIIATIQKLATDGIEAEQNAIRTRVLWDSFVADQSGTSLTKNTKLTLNEVDRSIYSDYLIEGKSPVNPNRLPKSNKLLLQARKYFGDRISDDKALSSSGHDLASLLEDVIAKKLVIIEILVQSQINAYTVFETLNARGLQLTQTDLIKNYLFSLMTPGNDLEHLQRRWKALVAKTSQEKFPDFLRYHLLCSQKKIRKEQLFKIVSSTVSTDVHVLQLIDDLEGRAELFSAIGDPSHNYWQGKLSLSNYVRELNLFRVRQMTPLIFAAREKLSDEAFLSVMRTLVIVSFRFTIVSTRNTNELEPIYSEAAQAVLTGKATTSAAVFELLKPIYIPDMNFEQDFQRMSVDTTGTRKKIAKYILVKLENNSFEGGIDPISLGATVEHILPENPSDSWKDFIAEDLWDESIYRLGNLSLLEEGLNRDIGNEVYSLKVGKYTQSVYRMTKELAISNPESWVIASIDERQARLAKSAAAIWRCDF